MNPIIFYYSNEGSTAKVAEGLAQATGGELRRLNVAGKAGPGAIFAALLGIGARLVDTDLSLDPEDAVVLMTPVWAGSPTPASTSFNTAAPDCRASACTLSPWAPATRTPRQSRRSRSV